MSNCVDCNPCVDNCPDENPCYDNCGCLNPTTWECLTNPGTHPTLGVTNDMNGVQVLAAIDAVIDEIQKAIDDIVEPTANGSDTRVKVTENDTTSGHLDTKIWAGTHISTKVNNAGDNEVLTIDVKPATLISKDALNALHLGSDGKLKVSGNVGSSTPLVIVEGNGVTITGEGTSSDPKVISVNSSISAGRPCFDGVWKNLVISTATEVGVAKIGGAPQYRIRHDGTVEFKGTLTYTVSFGPYSTGPRKIVQAATSVPTGCLTIAEQNGTADLKGMMYVDAPQPGADQITQQYGYIIRKVNNNIVIEFQGTFSSATNKTIVVSFDGAVFHPTIS